MPDRCDVVVEGPLASVRQRILGSARPAWLQSQAGSPAHGSPRPAERMDGSAAGCADKLGTEQLAAFFSERKAPGHRWSVTPRSARPLLAAAGSESNLDGRIGLHGEGRAKTTSSR